MLALIELSLQVAGGSLEESREALAIAETDDLFIMLYSLPHQPLRFFCFKIHCFGCQSKGYYSSQGGFSAQSVRTQLDARSLKKVGIPKNIFKLFCLWLEGIQKGKASFLPTRNSKEVSGCQEKYLLFELLAYATKLPMFLHMPAAAGDFCEIMERNINKFTRGVTHSFTGSAEDFDKLLSFHNIYIGVNDCFLKMAENLDVVWCIPVERMTIETDSPYCEIKSTHAGINL